MRPGQQLPDLPPEVEVAADPREGLGPLQGIAVGLAALSDRAEAAFVCSTDLPFLHPAFIGAVLGALTPELDVALPVARGYPQPLAAAYRTSLAPVVAALVAADRLRPAFLFDQCRVLRLDDASAAGRPGRRGARPRAGLGGQRQRAAGVRAGPRTARRPRSRSSASAPLANRAGAGPAYGARGHAGPGRGRRVRCSWTGTSSLRSTASRSPGTASCRSSPATRSRSSRRTPGGERGARRLLRSSARRRAGRRQLLGARAARAGAACLPRRLRARHVADAPPRARRASTRSAPEAPLAFVFSPLVGTPLTTSAKFAVVAKSPLTGMLNDALASSHFAISGKLTGHDAIVVRGRCAAPSVLLVDGAGARLVGADGRVGPPGRRGGAGSRRSASAAAGGSPRSARRASAASATPRSPTTAATPAGAASARCWAPRTSRRSPSTPRTKVAPADPAGVLAAARDLRARSFGPATAKYRELGTLANLLAFNAIHTLPTRNFPAATFDDAPRLAAEELAGAAQHRQEQLRLLHDRLRAHLPCAPAARRRGWSTRTCSRSARCAGCPTPTRCSRPAPAATSWASTPSRPAAPIAWAMECVERGLLDAPWLRFGDGAALLRALDEIGRREGLGRAAGRGVAAGRRGGRGTAPAAFAPQVKGLELPGYEPRTLQAMALGLAVNARGADHNRSGAYEADLSGDLDRFAGGEAHVAAAVETEDRAAVMDSMILCKFLRGVFTDPFREWAALLRAVTGWDVDGEELRATARRIVLAKRVFNLREGWVPGRRLAAGPAAAGAAGARAPGGWPRLSAATPARHGRRLLRRARPGRAGASAQRGRGRRPPAGVSRP